MKYTFFGNFSSKLLLFISLEICGDGIVSGNEECDDGNNINGNFHSYFYFLNFFQVKEQCSVHLFLSLDLYQIVLFAYIYLLEIFVYHNIIIKKI